MIGLLIFGIALVGMIFASWTDIKIREVPNRVSFGLIISMVVLRFLYALNIGDFSIFWTSIMVGGLFLGMGLAFFYAQQWGGADMKLMVVLGIGFATLLPEFNPVFVAMWPYFLTILLNFFIISVIYSIGFSFWAAFKNPKVFIDFRASMNKQEGLLLALSILIILVIGFYERIALVALAIPLMWALSKFLKAVENNCMYKHIPVGMMVEFDVPEHDIKVRKKVIVSKSDPNGITPEQIETVKKLAKQGKIPKTVRIKWGVPLIPVFPMTLLFSLFVGDAFLAMLSLV